MFEDIKSESTRRLIEIRNTIKYIKLSESRRRTTPANPSVTCMKGLFFVHLYGVYEYTISSCISSTLEYISNLNIKISDFKPRFLSMALNSDIVSLTTTGIERKWERRWEFFDLFQNDNIITFANDLIPTDGKNIRYRQLGSIWNSFSIQDPILPRPEIGGRIHEIVEFRNSIAHGNQSPSEIGRRFTPDDLSKRFEAINEYCTYFIMVLENYIVNRHYLKE
ncbi:hypothetical protein FE783_13715 [Paenibacillus mesophilus]|uniref:MAE_28990/MAE_18760 family HEPN-like nuclease n=1 Tax=Paenibacillus mesophilus TaxID=2582849 RepID=UPI00110D8D8D|nr:MAE_28990/MAE_18760 family HEPN-like nuclease [Paenibacillus mesophilus]TMV49554.1 hypothetical protein FE783_13715 [Paenibacillus mesophilus]